MSPSFSSPARLSSFALTILIGAFLVFQVQPLVSKAILPWFGGSPAVWTTCMLFFQAGLFGGYLYAHLLARWLAPRWQGVVHMLLVTVALLSLPILPDASWRPQGDEEPAARILMLLMITVGLPYFVLSATGPLVQAWFAHASGGRSPYRLFALSNFGSLAALLTYPFVFEPLLPVRAQGTFWAVAFAVYAVTCAACAVQLWAAPKLANNSGDASANVVVHAPPATWRRRALWLALPALASVMLLAVTNHVCQDIPATPFLWVVPLSLYLLSFIICFDNPRWYQRPLFAGGAIVLCLVLSQRTESWFIDAYLMEVWISFAALFFVCMLCHGELVRLKPELRHLTSFYLMVAAGGALGGCLVAVVCPLIFDSFFEMNLSVVAGYALAVVVLAMIVNGWKTKSSSAKLSIAATAVIGLIVVTRAELTGRPIGILEATRNFYGTLTVKQLQGAEDPLRVMVHGQVVHGIQYLTPQRRREATTYYHRHSGIGELLTHQATLQPQPLRVGAVGLGAGTVAVYGREGDFYRFYEINPAVIDFARRHFTFLDDSLAKVEVVLGDARLSMDREKPQSFDVLILDAFSGDSIPVHLLTREAFAVYLRHLQPEGILAAHISNIHLDLVPVVAGLAKCHGLEFALIDTKGKRDGHYHSQWILLSREKSALQGGLLEIAVQDDLRLQGEGLLWTDQYNNLFQILK